MERPRLPFLDSLGRLAAALAVALLLQLAASPVQAAGGSGNSGWWASHGAGMGGGWHAGGGGWIRARLCRGFHLMSNCEAIAINSESLLMEHGVLP